MMNNLDEIKQALRQTPSLAADDKKKSANINNALKQFDKNFSVSYQETSKPKRLKNIASTIGQFIFGRGNMIKKIIRGMAFVTVFGVLLLGVMFSILFSNTNALNGRDGGIMLMQGVSTSSSSDKTANRKSNSYAAYNTSFNDASGGDSVLPHPTRARALASYTKTPTVVAPLQKPDSRQTQRTASKQLMPVKEQLAFNSATQRGSDVLIDVDQEESISKPFTEPQKWNPVQRPADARKWYIIKNGKKIEVPAPPIEEQNFELMYLDSWEGWGAIKDKSIKASDIKTKPNQDQGRDKFAELTPSPLILTKQQPVSTFSIDVDTAAYGFVRASLNRNVLPPKEAVRIEELINYFPYDYAAPEDRQQPFKAHVAVFPTPWNSATKLLHIGIKGYQPKIRPRANLVFLIDTSGSMGAQNKLPLVQAALKMLLDTLDDEDKVSIVTYAGRSGIALKPTKVKDKSKIMAVIDNLGASGSTAGGEGIRLAYQLADQHFNSNGINRIILATDGDFNVGISDTKKLKGYIERKRKTGVSLSILGFGMGNYNDQLMQALAQNGNGHAVYIDSLNEARKALVNELQGTLLTIAKDVKIQLEFNPQQIAEYRLIGYETRQLKREDFNNDAVDAGDIGSGHSVTALYEITPVGSSAQLVDKLRYQQEQSTAKEAGQEYAFVKIRYKLPGGDTSRLITTAVDSKVEYTRLQDVPIDARFASSVAAFAQLLRGEPYLKDFGYNQVIELAQQAKGEDEYGYRAEFINLVRIAKNAPAIQALR